MITVIVHRKMVLRGYYRRSKPPRIWTASPSVAWIHTSSRFAQRLNRKAALGGFGQWRYLSCENDLQQRQTLGKKKRNVGAEVVGSLQETIESQVESAQSCKLLVWQ
jgi:hypothetical protein